MLRRFVDRFQLWLEEKRSEKEGSNPLTPWAVAAAVGVALDVRDLFTSAGFAWGALAHLILMLAFLVAYARKAAMAWIIVPLVGVAFLVHLPFASASSPSRPLAVWLVCALFALGIIMFGFEVRRRYRTYLEIERSSRIHQKI